VRVNYIVVYEGDSPSGEHQIRRITVGATDEDRWNEEIRLGGNGVDASTLAMFTVTHFQDKDWADTEVVEILALPGNPHREEVFSILPGLATIAYRILEEGLTEEQAYKTFLGVDAV